jgi:hypothetical protein
MLIVIPQHKLEKVVVWWKKKSSLSLRNNVAVYTEQRRYDNQVIFPRSNEKFYVHKKRGEDDRKEEAEGASKFSKSWRRKRKRKDM